jgi:hypothetical protein
MLIEMALQLQGFKPKFSSKLSGMLVAAFILAVQPLAVFAAPVINEVMANPVNISDAGGEWIEINNQGSASTDVSGWKVNDGGASNYTFPVSTILAADQLYVICRDSALAEVTCDAEWAGMRLNNSGDTISILDGATTIDSFTYVGSDAQSGKSVEVVREDNTKTAVQNTTDSYGTSGGNTGTPHAVNRAQSTAPVQNVDTGERFTTIQKAIDDSDTVNGNTIYIKDGTYDENPNVSKSLTLEGESEAGVIITADNGGYGLENTVDGLILVFKNFTLENSVHYGFKLTGSDATLTNVTVKNSARTELDFNGMSVVTLRNVTANGQGTSGNGVSFTNSNNIDIDGLTTTGNNWGGVALYPYGVDYPVGINSATILNLTASEPNELYVQQGPGGTPVGSITAPQYKYTVHNDEFRGNGSEYTLYQRTLSKATNFARSLQEAPNVINSDSSITQISNNVRLVPADGFTIKAAVEDAPNGGTVRLFSGVYDDDDEQIVVDHNVNVIGAGSSATTVEAQFNTGSGGDSRGWFLVKPGAVFGLRNVTLDGNGKKIWQAIRSTGSGDVTRVAFRNIVFDQSGPSYAGTAVAAFGDGPLNVKNSTFENIGRIGVQYFGAGVSGSVYNGNTYTGKGAGNWLDYALDINNGAQVRVVNSSISGNRGVASSDGSTSAGVLVTTFFGTGTQVRINNSTITDNTTGVAVGYNGADTSSVTGRNNEISGNGTGVYSTASLVDFRQNYWGSNSGPTDTVSGDGSVPDTNPGGTGDVAGANVRYNNWTIIDVEKPSLTVTNPLAGSSVRSTIAVEGEATDDQAVTILDLRVYAGACSGSAVLGPINLLGDYTGTNYSYDFDTNSLSDGTYCFKVTAEDAAGNKRFKEVSNVEIDNTTPDLSGLSYTRNSSGTYTLSVTTNDNSTPVSFTLDGNALSGASSADGGTTWTVTTGKLANNSTHTFAATSTDGAGNSTTTSSSSFTVPAGSNTDPTGNTDNDSDGGGQLGSTPGPISPLSTPNNTALLANVGNTGSVLGASINNDNESDDNGQVLGTKSDSSSPAETTAVAPSPEGWKLWGIAWYWFLLALALLAAFWWMLAGWRRRRAEDAADL